MTTDLWVVMAFYKRNPDKEGPPWMVCLEGLPAPMSRLGFETLINGLKMTAGMARADTTLRYVMAFDHQPDTNAIAKQVQTNEPVLAIEVVEFQIKGLN